MSSHKINIHHYTTEKGQNVNRIKWYNSVRFRIPVTIVVIILIPFLLIWWYNYSLLVNNVLEHSGKVVLSNLKNISLSIEGVTNNVEQFAKNCGGDSSLTENLKKYIASSGEDAQVARSNITINLNQKILFNSNIDSVYILIEGADCMLTNMRGAKEISVLQGNGKVIYDGYIDRLIGWSMWFTSVNYFGEGEEMLSYSHTISLGEGFGRCSLICNVRSARFSQIMSEIDTGGGYVLVCDFAGDVLIRSENADVESSIKESPEYRPAFGNMSLSDSYTTDKENVQYLVVYYRSGLTFWRYFQMVPMNYVVGSISSQIQMMFLILGFCIIVAMCGAVIVSRSVVRPLRGLASGMKKVEDGDLFPIRENKKKNDEIKLLANGFNVMVKKLKDLINEVYIQEIVRREAQLRAIQSQIDEHFLYNTLNSIMCSAHDENAKKTAEMISMLSRYFRINLSEGKSFVKVSEVLELINCYLFIQKIRFGRRLETELYVQPELYDRYVLKYIFQPIVENAVVHGFEDVTKNVKIEIILEGRDGLLYFEVKDSGIGMDATKLDELMKNIHSPHQVEGKNFALKNINAQIALTYGSEYRISIESEPLKGTSVSFTIPLRDTDKEETHE